MSPAEAVAEYQAGRIELAPPTLRILLELSALPDVEAVLRARDADPPRPIAPRPRMAGTELHLLLPGDEDYEAGAPPGRNRIVAVNGRWRSEGRGY
jgi:hypothetical protein